MIMKIKSDGFDGFAERVRERARKMDRKDLLKEESIFNFADPMDMAPILTAARIRLLRVVRTRHDMSVTTLADCLKRDTSAVRRDVEALEKMGILQTEVVPNPGHGRIRVVRPVANRITLTATL